MLISGDDTVVRSEYCADIVKASKMTHLGIPNLRVNSAGSRPATKLLAERDNLGYSLVNKFSSVLALPIVIARSIPPTFSVATAKRLQRTSDTHRQRRNPHSA